MAENTDLIQKIRKKLQYNLQGKFDKYIELCKQKGKKTIEVYADLANELGVSEDTVSQWNYGRQLPSKIEHFFLLCSIFGCSIDELFKGIDFSEKEIEDYKENGIAKETLEKIINLYKDDNIEKRQELEDIQNKFYLSLEKIVEQNGQPALEPKVLFGPHNVFKRAKYIDILNYIIMKDIIGSSLLKYYNDYRNIISSNIIKLYNISDFVGNLEHKEKQVQIEKQENIKAKKSIEEYSEKIALNKYGKIPLNCDVNRNPETTKIIYDNITKNLSLEDREKLEVADTILKDEITNFAHNIVIDMLFQSDEKTIKKMIYLL